jgi:hypothetical protein
MTSKAIVIPKWAWIILGQLANPLGDDEKDEQQSDVLDGC